MSEAITGRIEGISHEYLPSPLSMTDIERYNVKSDLKIIDSNNEEQAIPLTPLIGREITIAYNDTIQCSECGTTINKSYSGYCYPCFASLPWCDLCYVKPELCHLDKGTCRDEIWGRRTCLSQHYVYLSYTSEVKVGITRQPRLYTRWMEQGATLGVPIGIVKDRKSSGIVEVEIKEHVADKTNWRKMLKESFYDYDIEAMRQTIVDGLSQSALSQLELTDIPMTSFHFPVQTYPEKVTSIGLDKAPLITSKLVGIKGKYLLLESGVFNIDKHTGYDITFRAN